MIATYGENGKVDVMNMAWGGICADNMVALNIDEDHKTSANIKTRGAFTLRVADIPHIEAADFFCIATGNKMEDKFERSGLHAVKSSRIDAPIVEEFPLTLECKVVECQQTVYGFRVLGEIMNVLADEKVLDEKGKVIPEAERVRLRPMPQRLLCRRREGRASVADGRKTHEKIISKQKGCLKLDQAALPFM